MPIQFSFWPTRTPKHLLASVSFPGHPLVYVFPSTIHSLYLGWPQHQVLVMPQQNNLFQKLSHQNSGPTSSTWTSSKSPYPTMTPNGSPCLRTPAGLPNQAKHPSGHYSSSSHQLTHSNQPWSSKHTLSQQNTPWPTGTSHSLWPAGTHIPLEHLSSAQPWFVGTLTCGSPWPAWIFL